MRKTPCLVALVAPILLAGCASAPTHLLLLDAVSPEPAAIHADYRGPPIVVPAVHVPAALDRSEFVTRTGVAEAKIDDLSHWAAPLGLLVRDALVRDLTARLPEGKVLPPGSGGRAGMTRTIDVTILTFDAQPGSAFLQAAYRVLPSGPVRQVQFCSASAEPDPAASARILGGFIGKLADRIAADAS